MCMQPVREVSVHVVIKIIAQLLYLYDYNLPNYLGN